MRCRQLGLRANAKPAEYAAIHRSILAGSLSLVGLKDERGEYLGARNLRFRIFPGSALASARPKWLVGSEISETQRVYARCVAAIEPEWIEAARKHLLKRSYSEPHWDARRGETVAFEKVSLFGLPLVERRRVAFKRIDRAQAREIFIRAGLLTGASDDEGRVPATQPCAGARRSASSKQSSGAAICLRPTMYLRRSMRIVFLPTCATSATSNAGVARAERRDPKLLFMSREDVLQPEGERSGDEGFPSTLVLHDVEFRLRYSFAPGAIDDGVSLQVPLGLLAHVRQEPLDWLVPGLLGASCEALDSCAAESVCDVRSRRCPRRSKRFCPRCCAPTRIATAASNACSASGSKDSSTCGYRSTPGIWMRSMCTSE